MTEKEPVTICHMTDNGTMSLEGTPIMSPVEMYWKCLHIMRHCHALAEPRYRHIGARILKPNDKVTINELLQFILGAVSLMA